MKKSYIQTLSLLPLLSTVSRTLVVCLAHRVFNCDSLKQWVIYWFASNSSREANKHPLGSQETITKQVFFATFVKVEYEISNPDFLTN